MSDRCGIAVVEKVLKEEEIMLSTESEATRSGIRRSHLAEPRQCTALSRLHTFRCHSLAHFDCLRLLTHNAETCYEGDRE